MATDLDVEAFIQEIEKRPEIWDVNCEDNRFKMRKQRAWVDIARTFVENYDQLAEVEKLDVFRKLFGKWRNIRDTFVRYKKKPGKKSYIYAKSLTFLNSVYKHNSGSEAEGENDSSSNQQILHYSSDDDPRMKKKRLQFKVLNDSNWSDDEVPSTIDNLKRKRVPNVKTEAVEFVETPFSETFTTEDDDRSFFESLLPAIRQFDMDQKLEFRSQVLSVVQNIRSSNHLSKPMERTGS